MKTCVTCPMLPVGAPYVCPLVKKVVVVAPAVVSPVCPVCLVSPSRLSGAPCGPCFGALSVGGA
jgi:hypothetical protein